MQKYGEKALFECKKAQKSTKERGHITCAQPHPQKKMGEVQVLLTAPLFAEKN